MNGKKGITLMALALTIIVMIIILGTIVTGLALATNSAESKAYAKDLRTIEEAISIKEAERNYEFLYVDYDNTGYDKPEIREVTPEAIKNSISAEKANQLQEEFVLNGDQSTKIFYIVEVNKLGIKKNIYGKERAIPNAVVMSKDTGNIYYINGKTIDGKTYFSTSSRLLKIAKENGFEESATGANINLEEKMHITKLTRSWSNAVEIKINTSLNSGQTVSVLLGSKIVDITSYIKNGIFTIKAGAPLNLTALEIEALNEIQFMKKNGSIVTDTKKVDIRNYDGTAPTNLKQGVKVTPKDKVVNFYAEDIRSKKVDRYIYVVENMFGASLPTDQVKLKEYIIKKGKVGYSNNVKVNTTDVKVGWLAIDAAGNVSSASIVDCPYEPKPDLQPGMTPVKWVENSDGSVKEVATVESDKEWYSYNNRKWANAKTADGSYWVWIPRFEYKITYTDTTVPIEKAQGVKIDTILVPIEKTIPTEGYKIHPAFKNGSSNSYANGEWDKEISGFWVAKYEMSMEKFENGNWVNKKTAGKKEFVNFQLSDTIRAVSKPGKYPWTEINCGTAYTNSFKYDRAKESHMMKNSEWGAVAYLTHSNFGTGGQEVGTNNSLDWITGSGTQGDPSHSPASTQNIYGVYDLNGGSREYVPAYIANTASVLSTHGGSFTQEGGMLKTVSTKYATVYPHDPEDDIVTDYSQKNFLKLSELAEVGLRYGDAIAEIADKGLTDSTGVFGDVTMYPSGDNPFFLRGGNLGYGAGIFAFEPAYGTNHARYSYRIVFCRY